MDPVRTLLTLVNFLILVGSVPAAAVVVYLLMQRRRPRG